MFPPRRCIRAVVVLVLFSIEGIQRGIREERLGKQIPTGAEPSSPQRGADEWTEWFI